MTGDSQMFPMRNAAQLIEYLQSQNVDTDALLRKAGIRSLADQQGYLTSKQMEELVKTAEAMSGRNDLGFELGRRIRLSSNDILGYALITSPTVGHVVQLLAQYHRLVMPAFSLRLLRQNHQVELHFLPVLPMSDRTLRFNLEAIAVAIHTQLCSMVPDNMTLPIQRANPCPPG